MTGQAPQQLQWATIRVDQLSPRYESIKFGEQWYGINAPLTKQMFQVGQTYQVGLQFSTRGKPYIVESPQIPTAAASPVGAGPTPTVAGPGPIALPAPPPPAAVPGVPGVALVATAPLPQVPVTPVAALPAPGGPPPIPPPVAPLPGNGNIAPLADLKQASIEKQVRQKAVAEVLKGFAHGNPAITLESMTQFGKGLNDLFKGF